MATFSNPSDPQAILKDLGEGRNWLDPNTPACVWDNNVQQTRTAILSTGIEDRNEGKLIRGGDALLAIQLFSHPFAKQVLIECHSGFIPCVLHKGWWALTIPVLYLWYQYGSVRLWVDGELVTNTPMVLRYLMIEDGPRRQIAQACTYGDDPPIEHQYSTGSASYHGNELRVQTNCQP